MRVVFMGSPMFAVPSLEALVRDQYDVVAVYTQPDKTAGRGRTLIYPPVKEAALKMGLPVVQVVDLRTPEALAELAGFKPDTVAICAFGQILPQEVLDIPPYQCLNIHFSLLPRHRGASPVAAAILSGDEFTGVTIQLVRKKLDTGPVLASAAVPILPVDTTGILTSKLSLIGANLLLEALNGWRNGDITPREQDEAGVSYFGQITKEDGEIDWHLSAVTIWRRIRAFQPWPGCYTTWRGKLLKILESVPVDVDATVSAGQVATLPDYNGGLGIGTGEGVLGVRRVQLEGKRVMTASEFANGQRDFVGAVLPC